MSSQLLSDFQSHMKSVKDYVYENKWRTAIIAGASTFTMICTRYIYNKIYRKVYSLPPGPEGMVPFIGYTLETIMQNNWHINVAMTYGPIACCKMLTGPGIVISDSKIAKDLFSRPDLQFRNEKLQKKFFNIISKTGDQSFLSYNGKKWSKGRQLMHSKLIRMLNTKYVNQIFKDIIKNEFEPFLQNIINDASNPNNLWYPIEMCSYLTFNTIYQANFGKACDLKKDKQYVQFSKDLQSIFDWRVGLKQFTLFLFPFLKYSNWYMKDLIELRDRLNDTATNIIEKRRNKTAENEMKKDVDNMTFIDYNNELMKDNKLSEGRLMADIMIMFLVGTDTTALSLEHGIILLAKQPDIQHKIRRELQVAVDDEKQSLFDINLLLKVPCFRALIHEILRISTIVRVLANHYLLNEIWYTTDDGKKYRFPKGSMVTINIDYIHNYSKNENWKNNENYKRNDICLENWLNDDGKFQQNQSFLTFGYGKRDCVGRQLALKEIRIILAYLLLNYKLSLKDPKQEVRVVGGNGIGIAKIEPGIPVIVEKL
eukprot:370322_1